MRREVSVAVYFNDQLGAVADKVDNVLSDWRLLAEMPSGIAQRMDQAPEADFRWGCLLAQFSWQ